MSVPPLLPRLAGAGVTVLVAIALVAAAPAVLGAGSSGPGGGAVKADRDGDRVFDDLESKIAGAAPTARVSAIVTLHGAASPARIRALEAAVGDLGVTHRFSLIDGFAATMTAAQVRALAAAPAVAHVEENSVVHATNASAQQSFGVAEARADVFSLDGDADGNPTYSPADLVAAVIDTGIRPDHTDLNGGKVIGWNDLVNGRTSPYDDQGHGTHVAATIAGDGDGGPDGKGVAPRAGLVGVKVLDQNGSGTMAAVAQGIQWVVNNNAALGVEVINLSLGTSGCSDGLDATSQAVNAAADAGIVVVVAAGNAGSGTCTIGSPGAAAKAVTVGAMADAGVNGFKQAYFSSRGKTLDGRIKPDVSAPGVSITSADAATTTGYVTMSGTSMATPFTAGTALLMRDANGALTSAQVKDKLMQTAIDWGRGGDNKTAGSTGVDIDYGAGRLDAYAAIASAGGAGGALTSPPGAPAHQLQEGTLSGTGAQVEYTLNVTTTDFPIAATLIHPGVTAATASSPDFDLHLIAPDGTQVAAAETTRRQDELGFKPTVTGTYRLRVRSFSGSGAYFVDTSAGTAPDTAAPTVTGNAPTGTAVSPNANVSVTFSEPMDQTVTESSFTLSPALSPAVPGVYSWTGNTLMFDPTADLDKGVQYTAAVGVGAKDKAGNALSSQFQWTFTTSALATFTAVPNPVTIELGGGTLRAGDSTRLAVNDNSYYEVNSTTSGTRATSWYGSFAGVSNAASDLQLTYSGANSRACTQSLWLWNWNQTTPAWTQLGVSNSVQGEVLLTRSVTGSLADYVSATGELRVRVRCTRTDRTFVSRGDLMQIVYKAP